MAERERGVENFDSGNCLAKSLTALFSPTYEHVHTHRHAHTHTHARTHTVTHKSVTLTSKQNGPQSSALEFDELRRAAFNACSRARDRLRMEAPATKGG